MALTSDSELWALALYVERKHGADGPRFIAERIGALALSGDTGGVDLWRGVAERFEALLPDKNASL